MDREPAAAFRSRHLPFSPKPSRPMPTRALSSSRRPALPRGEKQRPSVLASASSSGRAPPVASADVVVVGGGIIGLWCALSLLRSPENFTVALVEAEAATAGGGGGGGVGGAPPPPPRLPPLPRATGAGQGYLWLAHRPPGTPGWDFAVDSLAMWRAEVLGLGAALFDDSSSSAAARGSSSSSLSGASPSSSSSRRPYERTDWAARGSLLLAPEPGASSSRDGIGGIGGGGGGGGGLADCEARAEALRAAGLAGARALDSAQLSAAEPALSRFERGAGGLFVPSDVQINGRGAAADVLERCFAEGGGGSSSSSAKQRFSVVSGERAASLVRTFPGSPVATGVRTASGAVIAVGRAVVVAAGVWSGEFLDASDCENGGENDGPRNRPWRRVFAPRRGHLLEVRRGTAVSSSSPFPALRHGVMELSYARHYDATAAAPLSVPAAQRALSASASAAASFAPSAADEELGVVFTAAPADATGQTLLVGSSREEGGGGAGSSDGGEGSYSSSSSGGSDSEGGTGSGGTADPLLELSAGDAAAAHAASLPSAEVVEAVLRRAALFLPELAPLLDPSSSSSASASVAEVRVGLRPASSSGMPVVGRVPSFGGSGPSSSSSSSSSAAAAESGSNVIVAAGHEGSGLTLAPATAALVGRLVAGEPERALPAYYSALRPERALEAARRRNRRVAR